MRNGASTAVKYLDHPARTAAFPLSGSGALKNIASSDSHEEKASRFLSAIDFANALSAAMTALRASVAPGVFGMVSG